MDEGIHESDLSGQNFGLPHVVPNFWMVSHVMKLVPVVSMAIVSPGGGAAFIPALFEGGSSTIVQCSQVGQWVAASRSMRRLSPPQKKTAKLKMEFMKFSVRISIEMFNQITFN